MTRTVGVEPGHVRSIGLLHNVARIIHVRSDSRTALAMTLFGAPAEASHSAALSGKATFYVQVVLIAVRVTVVRSGPAQHLVV